MPCKRAGSKVARPPIWPRSREKAQTTHTSFPAHDGGVTVYCRSVSQPHPVVAPVCLVEVSHRPRKTWPADHLLAAGTLLFSKSTLAIPPKVPAKNSSTLAINPMAKAAATMEIIDAANKTAPSRSLRGRCFHLKGNAPTSDSSIAAMRLDHQNRPTSAGCTGACR